VRLKKFLAGQRLLKDDYVKETVKKWLSVVTGGHVQQVGDTETGAPL
jgi:hypothetical protein